MDLWAVKECLYFGGMQVVIDNQISIKICFHPPPQKYVFPRIRKPHLSFRLS